MRFRCGRLEIREVDLLAGPDGHHLPPAADRVLNDSAVSGEHDDGEVRGVGQPLGLGDLHSDGLFKTLYSPMFQAPPGLLVNQPSSRSASRLHPSMTFWFQAHRRLDDDGEPLHLKVPFFRMVSAGDLARPHFLAFRSISSMMPCMYCRNSWQ